jgi:2-amino-4-hydroxy-6-hydroxymethyldihydropteridine diphosphokinase
VSDSDSQSNGNAWVRAFIGLGSNEGDRLGFVQQAMQFLKDHPNIEVVECSSLYETEPVGREYIEWFVNAVASIETDLSPRELLQVCQDIEIRLTRLSGADSPEVFRETVDGLVKARIIDLDILFYAEDEVDTSYLKVPHPNIDRRAYALVPLLEIAPDWRHPTLGKTVTQMHEALPAPEQVFLYGTREGCDFG